MKFPTLTFTHRFASGRVATLLFIQRENSMPQITGSDCTLLSLEEQAEYRAWRAAVLAELDSRLTDGEVRGCAEEGMRKIQDSSQR